MKPAEHPSFQPDLIATFRPKQVLQKSFAKLVQAGVTIARLNASHCTEQELRDITPALKAAKLALMLDLPGPEIRIFGYDAPIRLSQNQRLEIGGPNARIQTNFTHFQDLMLTAPANLMNGEIQAFVLKISPDSFTLAIHNDGILRPNAHITFPTLPSSLPYPGERDHDLIRLACELRWDYLALSMLATGQQLRSVKSFISSISPDFSPLLAAKIETPEALEHLEDIIREADSVFVARGDLGNSISLESIPPLQKEIIALGNTLAKPVWVATQMLSSMTTDPVPTRAEVSDVANALCDGAAGITLSEETAVGKYPLQAIRMAKSIMDHTSTYLQNKREALPKADTTKPLPHSLELQSLLDSIGDIGSLIWKRGWAEANAGNLSIRVDDLLTARQREGKHWYLVSRSGSRYRQLQKDPMRELLLVADDGQKCTVHGSSGSPTSEWHTHLALQRWFLEHTGSEKVILHAHPEPIVILGDLDIFADEALLNNTLAELLPELPLYLPEGIACCPSRPPGSEALAQQTLVCAPRSRAIIWQKHGILCCAPDPDAAFDLMEIVTKAVSVYLTKLSLR